jgi:hypothetical protein
MKTISTKYAGATDRTGARIIATTSEGGRATVSYPHELSGAAAHWQAAHKLAKRLGWTGTMQAGGIKNGYIFVFIDREDQFTI